MLLPNGTVYWGGSTTHNAIYNIAAGTWSAVRTFPQAWLSTPLPRCFPAGMCWLVTSGASPSPSHFFEFNGTAFTGRSRPSGSEHTTVVMLSLSAASDRAGADHGWIVQHLRLYPCEHSSGIGCMAPNDHVCSRCISPRTTYRDFGHAIQRPLSRDPITVMTRKPRPTTRSCVSPTGRPTIFSTQGHTITAPWRSLLEAPFGFDHFDVPAGIETGLSDIEVVANGIPSAKTAITVNKIAVTVQTNPAGQQDYCGRKQLSTPQTFSWIPFYRPTSSQQPHPQVSGATRYVFSNWSDAEPISHSVAPAAATTYTANFTTQYLLATNVFPSGGGIIGANPVSGDGYYNSGTSVQLTASANAGFTFSNWSGDLTGTTNPQSVVMSVPRTVNANFNGISSGLRFVPVSPCRVMDTRLPTGPLGGPFLAGGSTRRCRCQPAPAGFRRPPPHILECHGCPKVRDSRLFDNLADWTSAAAGIHAEFARRFHSGERRNRPCRHSRVDQCFRHG